MPHRAEQSDGDTSAIRKIVDKAQHEGLIANVQRIESLEEDTERHAERLKIVEDTLNEGKLLFNTLQLQARYMQESLDNVNKTLKKVMWIILTAVILAIVYSVLKYNTGATP